MLGLRCADRGAAADTQWERLYQQQWCVHSRERKGYTGEMNLDWGALGLGDVVPVPFALETNWRPGHLEMNVIIVLDQDESGYVATSAIWSTTVPYNHEHTSAHAAEARAEALRRFARDLAGVMKGKGMDSGAEGG